MPAPAIRTKPVVAGTASTAGRQYRRAQDQPAQAPRGARSGQGRQVEELLRKSAEGSKATRQQQGAQLLQQLKTQGAGTTSLLQQQAAASAARLQASQQNLMMGMLAQQQALAANQPVGNITVGGDFARGTSSYGSVNLSTFKKSLPSWYKPVLMQWRGVVMQSQAMLALQAASNAVGVAILGGGYRSHAQQVQTYNNKPGLAAPPGYSYHEVGLAIDVNVGRLKQLGVWEQARRALLAAGFRQFDAQKEPWHFSYVVTG